MVLLAALPALAVAAVHGRVRALQLGVCLATVGALPRSAWLAVVALVDLRIEEALAVLRVLAAWRRAPLEPVHCSDQVLYGVDDDGPLVVLAVVAPAGDLLGLLLLDVVDAPALPVEEDPGGLGQDHVAELDVGLLAGRAGSDPCVLSQTRREDSQEIRLLLLVLIEARASGLLVLLELGLELRYARLDGLQVLDRPGVQHAHLAAELFELQRQAVVDEPHDAPPAVQAVAHLSLLEHRVRRPGEALG